MRKTAVETAEQHGWKKKSDSIQKAVARQNWSVLFIFGSLFCLLFIPMTLQSFPLCSPFQLHWARSCVAGAVRVGSVSTGSCWALSSDGWTLPGVPSAEVLFWFSSHPWDKLEISAPFHTWCTTANVLSRCRRRETNTQLTRSPRSLMFLGEQG